METKVGLTYRDAGVDIDRATAAKDRIRNLARSTFNGNVLSDIGSFGGLFRLETGAIKEPVLVASTDGVGTKLKVATQVGRLNTIGQDLVNHCINDILVQGAKPLFFLDYFASAGLPPETVAEVVSGIAKACGENDTALLGGETAEMPGLYAAGDFDLAGTIVGIVDRDRIVDGARLAPGDKLLGLPSDGLHTNGYSLARKVLFEVAALSPETRLDQLEKPLGDELLRVHRSYLPTLRRPLELNLINGMAHITGGGITDNVPRILPEGMNAQIDTTTWVIPPLFQLVAKLGGVAPAEMLRTFNMGIGMIIGVRPGDVSEFRREVPEAFVIGSVTTGDRRVVYR